MDSAARQRSRVVRSARKPDQPRGRPVRRSLRLPVLHRPARPYRDIAEGGPLPFASYIDNLIELPELSYLHEAAGGARAVFRSSSISAQQAAVANGLGIGLLHAFAADEDERLVRLLPDEIEVVRTYWLAMHEDQRSVPRVRAVVDLIDGLVAGNAGRF